MNEKRYFLLHNGALEQETCKPQTAPQRPALENCGLGCFKEDVNSLEAGAERQNACQLLSRLQSPLIVCTGIYCSGYFATNHIRIRHN